MGRSFKRAHCKRNLVVTRRQAAYKLPRTQGSFSSLKRVPKSLLQQYRSSSHRQHYSRVIHKQGRRHEVGHTLCPTVEDLDLVYQESGHPQSPTHPRPGCRGIVFTHGVRVGGHPGGRAAGKSLSGLYLRNRKV